jgi:hypothetical protein
MTALGYGFSDLRFVISQWANMGVFDVLLPLVLVFAVVFSILQRSGILGRRRAIDATVAFVISLFVIANRYVSELFLPIFSQAGLTIIILVAVMLILGLFVSTEETPKSFRTMMGIGGIALFFWLMKTITQTYGIWIFPQYWWVNNSWWVILAVGFALVIFFIVKSGSEEEKKVKPQQGQLQMPGRG